MEQALTANLESTLQNPHVIPGQPGNFFGYELNRPELLTEKTINNYLKTPAEMDAEFSMEMNIAKSMIFRQLDTLDIYRSAFREGNINTYNPDVTPLGFMEENY